MSEVDFDKHYAGCLSHFTCQLTQLQHLSIEYGGDSDVLPESQPWMPTLQHLAQLKTLKFISIECTNSYTRSGVDKSRYRDTLRGLAQCPQSLESLCIERQEGSITVQPIPALCQGFISHLSCLTALELVACDIVIPTGFMSCLSGLSKLSIAQSRLADYRESRLAESHFAPDNAFAQLRKLTYLDLTDSTRHTLGWCTLLGPEATFVASQSLRIFKVTRCSLFNANTNFVLPAVTDVYAIFTSVHFKSAQMHIDKNPCDLIIPPTLTPKPQSLGDVMWCRNLVTLKYCSRDRAYKSMQLIGIARVLLDQCCSLQVLSLSGNSEQYWLDKRVKALAPGIMVNQGYGGHVADLRLEHMVCSAVNLTYCSTLTRLALRQVDGLPDACNLELPETLQQLECLGRTLFDPGSTHASQMLPQLERLINSQTKYWNGE